MTTERKWDSRKVAREFKKFWADLVKSRPELGNDVPAKRQAFSNYVDDLQRQGAITEKVASFTTMENA
ncbi:MAG: hypothetical protein ACSLE8_06305 [Rhodococcus sp. (in: high G+C Gram-positive bacteria)]